MGVVAERYSHSLLCSSTNAACESYASIGAFKAMRDFHPIRASESPFRIEHFEPNFDLPY